MECEGKREGRMILRCWAWKTVWKDGALLIEMERFWEEYVLVEGREREREGDQKFGFRPVQ